MSIFFCYIKSWKLYILQSGIDEVVLMLSAVCREVWPPLSVGRQLCRTTQLPIFLLVPSFALRTLRLYVRFCSCPSYYAYVYLLFLYALICRIFVLYYSFSWMLKSSEIDSWFNQFLNLWFICTNVLLSNNVAFYSPAYQQIFWKDALFF